MSNRSFAIGHHLMQNPCHIPYTVSQVAMSLSNSMTESDNFSWTEYNVSEWFWRNAQCIPVKTGQAKGVPTPKLKCESESDPLDIACHDAVMMMLDVISELDMHFQLGSAIMSRRTFIQLKHLQ